MLFKFSIKTNSEEIVNITRQVEKAVKDSGVKDGICMI